SGGDLAQRPENRMGKPVATSGQPFGWNDGYGARRRHRSGSLPHRKVIVLESDGSMLLSLFNLPTLANLDPENLKVFVFDNQVYSGTRISEPTATAGKTDLARMARGAGIEHAVTVASLTEFRAEMETAVQESGLKFVVCKIEESVGHRAILRTDLDPLENKYQFVRYLER